MHRLLLPLLLASSSFAQGFGPGAVYTLTNDTQTNGVAVGLRLFGEFVFPLGVAPTGGTGTGMGLGSQGALATSSNNRMLFAVNPGSGELSMFRVFANIGLFRSDVVSTHGMRPTSVAVHDDLVYAMNADSDDLAGFRIENGRLVHLGNTALSGTGVAAAQVGFTPRGDALVVTERATNQILVYPVRGDGTLGTAVVNASAGMTPFGFVFRSDGLLVVSEAAGGAANASVASTYRVRRDGSLFTVSAAVPTEQSAACWIAIPRSEDFAYTTNTASGTITGYAIGRRGNLQRLDRNGITGNLGAAARPLDFEFDPAGRVLFVLDSNADEIVVLRRSADGSLRNRTFRWSLPDGAAGLLVR